MSPFEIDILMHYYVSPEEHEVVRNNPPIWTETREWFLKEQLLAVRKEPSQYGATYECTSRGMAWIQYICALPLPEHQWTIKP